MPHFATEFLSYRRVRFMVESIRFVRPDVALAFIHAKLISRVPLNAIASAARQSESSSFWRNEPSRRR